MLKIYGKTTFILQHMNFLSHKQHGKVVNYLIAITLWVYNDRAGKNY